jgi:hypothetical protein
MSSISKDDLTVISRLFSKTEKTDEFELIITNHDNKYFGQEKYIQLLKYLKHRSLSTKTEIKNIDILDVVYSHDENTNYRASITGVDKINKYISQLDLFSTESFYTRVTSENESKFLKRLKSVINKNKLKLSGRDVENTVRKINPKLYSGLIIHDKSYPNNKWIPYLFPKHVFGVGESKLSFKNTIIEMIQHDVDEVATKEKELVGKGAFHNVYPSNKNPNMVYKIGFDEDVNGWVDLFKSRPDIFPKVYGTGYVNIKLKKQVTNFSWRTGEFKPITYNPGDTVKVKYVGVERLDTEKARQHWNSLANVVSVMSGKSLQTYLTSLGMDEEMEEEFLSIGERIKETGNDFIYNIFVEFYNLIQSVYELKPVADVHVGNYGYDKDGNLKCLDI